MQQHSEAAAPSLVTGGGFSLPEEGEASPVSTFFDADDAWPGWVGKTARERREMLDESKFYTTLIAMGEHFEFPDEDVASFLMPKGADPISEFMRLMDIPKEWIDMAPAVIREQYIPLRTHELLAQSPRTALHIQEQYGKGRNYELVRFLPAQAQLNAVAPNAARLIEDAIIEMRFNATVAATAESGEVPDGPLQQAVSASFARRFDQHRKILEDQGFSKEQSVEIWALYPDALRDGRPLTEEEKATILPSVGGRGQSLDFAVRQREVVRRVLNDWTGNRQVPAEGLATQVATLLDGNNDLKEKERHSYQEVWQEEKYQADLKLRQAAYEARYSSDERQAHHAAYAAKQYENGIIQSDLRDAFYALHGARDGADTMGVLRSALARGQKVGVNRLDVLVWASEHGIQSLAAMTDDQLADVKASGDFFRALLARVPLDFTAQQDAIKRYGVESIVPGDDAHEAILLLRALEKDGLGGSDGTRRRETALWVMDVLRTRRMDNSFPHPSELSSELERLGKTAADLFHRSQAALAELNALPVSPVQKASEQVRTFRETMHLVREYTGILLRNGWAELGTNIGALIDDLRTLGGAGAKSAAAAVHLQEIMALPEKDRFLALLDPDLFLTHASEAERARIATQGMYILGLLVGGVAGKPVVQATGIGRRLIGGTALGVGMTAAGSMGQDAVLGHTENLYGNAFMAVFRTWPLIAGGSVMMAGEEPIRYGTRRAYQSLDPVFQKVGQGYQTLDLKIREAYASLRLAIDEVNTDGLPPRLMSEFLQVATQGRVLENVRLPIDRALLIAAVDRLDPNTRVSLESASLGESLRRILSDPAYEPTLVETIFLEWVTGERLSIFPEGETMPDVLKTMSEERKAFILEEPELLSLIQSPEERARIVARLMDDPGFSPDLLGPEMAEQRRQIINGMLDLREKYAAGEDTTAAARTIADLSTRRAGESDLVILGKWDADGGYSGEAKRRGATWYETSQGVFEKIADGLSPKQKDAIMWLVNEQFLIRQMEKGVARIELFGESIDYIMQYRRSSFTAREINFLNKFGADYGYYLNENTWVKLWIEN